MTMISDSAMLSELAAEFPGYEFSTQRTWEGVSLIAVRQKGSARSGLYVVITPDLDEMRRTLLPGSKERSGIASVQRTRATSAPSGTTPNAGGSAAATLTRWKSWSMI